jgi:hypothetical protein
MVSKADGQLERRSKARVFISYSRKDIAFADRLDAALKARGFEPLIDRTDIYAFEEWWKRVQALISRADTLVFVLSPDAVRPGSVALKEVEFSASLNKRFAPIVFRPVEDKSVPEALAKLNFVFFDDESRFEESADRLAEALNTDIGWIRQHTDFGEQARRWVESRRPGGLLLRSPILEEAERWISSRPRGAPSPVEGTQEFILESRRAATRRRNLLVASLGAGFVLALLLAGIAYWQREAAEQQRQIAVEQRGQAISQRDRALLTQSRFLANASNSRRNLGDVDRALALALEALPIDGADRPYLPDAEQALRSAYRDWQAIQLKQSDLSSVQTKLNATGRAGDRYG